ncbi:MAG: serine/threonine protein kinase, partial [Planctomycetes bacterium]|nr:serine/threonine protein kinase [Planctomycetota bacterium]
MTGVDELPEPLGERFERLAEYHGGEGRTFRVASRSDGREAVLKVLAAGAEPAEASLLLSLRHPSIPAVREVGRLPDGRAFVLREHVDGEALQRLPSDVAELRTVLQQLLEVLAYVHLRSVLHLDLKPSNLLRDRHGRLHLLDFGLGVRGGAAGRGGTPFFAAPEQLLGGRPDARTDLFAVGAMAAQALWPGSGPPLARFLDSFPQKDFFSAGGLRPEDLPAPFDRFVARCTERRPERRFADAQAAMEFLCGGGAGRPSLALLAPDPVVLFAAELAAVPDDGTHLLWRGGSPGDRRALALHLAATDDSVRRIDDGDHALRVVRRGPGTTLRQLPDLRAEHLAPHVHSALGLHGEPAARAAAWLVGHGGTSGEAVAACLRELAQSGELIASGTRWAWPAARSGRLDGVVLPPASAALPTTAAALRSLAAAGRRDAAVLAWQRAVAAEPGRDEELRTALAEGLLDGGEPAAALPFCVGAPVLRAQALLDTGQLEAAR